MGSKNNPEQSSANSTGGKSDSNILGKMIADKQKQKRIEKLQNNPYRSPADEAELAVLKKGGSQREAFLASKKYNKGLSDLEADELKYLAEGKAPREAELRAKEDNRKLNLFEKRELEEIKFGSGQKEDSPALPPPDTYKHQ